jgi:hypothetical protein
MMVYPLSSLAAPGIGSWIVISVVKRSWARIVGILLIVVSSAACWELIQPQPKSLYDNFALWTLVLTLMRYRRLSSSWSGYVASARRKRDGVDGGG